MWLAGPRVKQFSHLREFSLCILDMEEQAFPGMEEGDPEEQAESSSDQEWEEDERYILCPTGGQCSFG